MSRLTKHTSLQRKEVWQSHNAAPYLFCEGHDDIDSGGRPGFLMEHSEQFSTRPQLRDSAGLYGNTRACANVTGFAVTAHSIREMGA